MYSTSATFKNLIKADERMFFYSGTIVTTAGVTYDFDGDDIRSGKITRAICEEKLEIGTVFASELDCELGLEVSRYELYGGTITLNIQLEGAEDVIPMGIFTIAEINQTVDRLKIKAYDAMVKLDNVAFSVASNNEILTPHEWLVNICEACDVELGLTQSEVKSFPNGNRTTGFADCVTDADSYRDVLGYLAAYLGSFAFIGRDGKLYLGRYSTFVADTISANFRYSSGLSDFRTTYDGLYATYKDGGVQEYVSNNNTDGIILDLGVNPFLQFSNESNRLDALQEIIDAWNGIYYIPFQSSIPMNPIYDPGDVLTFTGNQAGEYDSGAITEIVYTIGGQMGVTCTGDNPRLALAQDRFSKSVAGLSSDYNNGQEVGGKNFWLLFTENDSALTVGSTKTLVAEIEFKQTTDVQKMGLMFTCEAAMSATATVDIEITVDDEEEYSFPITEEKAVKGKRPFNRTCGFRVIGKGTHVAKVYMTVTDNPTLWSDMV